MLKSVYAAQPSDLFDIVEDCPDLLVSFFKRRDGSYEIQLLDYAMGETFRL